MKNFGLSKREQEVYEIIATTDLTYKQIADKMCLSWTTIETHKQNIYQKLFIKNRAQLTRRYYEGLLHDQQFLR